MTDKHEKRTWDLDTGQIAIPEGTSIEEANKIGNVVGTVYWNFFMPVLTDNKTPAEAVGIKPPTWLQELINKYRESELTPVEKAQIETDTNAFARKLSQSIIWDIGTNKLSLHRSLPVLKIMDIMTPELEEEMWEAFRAAHAQDKPPQIIKILIPFMAYYHYKPLRRVKNTFANRFKVNAFFQGEEHPVFAHRNEHGQTELWIRRKNDTVRICVISYEKYWVPEDQQEQDVFNLGSASEEKYIAAKDVVARLLPKAILIKEETEVHTGNIRPDDL
jgi:hypothetical protein